MARPDQVGGPTPTVSGLLAAIQKYEITVANDSVADQGAAATQALTDSIGVFREPIVQINPALAPLIDALLFAIRAIGPV